MNDFATDINVGGTDMISRKAAIEALYSQREKSGNIWVRTAITNCVEAIEQLPPAQPEKRTEERTETHACDSISRQAAITAIDNYGCDGEDSCGEPWIYMENAVEAIEMVEPLPPAEPKRGRWISADAMFGGVPFYCSECGENTLDTVMGKPRWNFCPNCGADMREKGENSESN